MDRYLQILMLVLLTALLGVAMLHTIDLPAADDLPRHIKNGELLLSGNWDVWYKNVYSYTEPDHPFVNHHWLGGVIFYLVYGLAGFKGLVIFKMAVFVATFLIIFAAARRRAGFWLVAALSPLAILVLVERSGVRPEIFSFFFVAVFLYALLYVIDHPERESRLWLLVPLQVVWVNTHIFFIIGPLMVAGFLLERMILHSRDLRADPLIRKLGALFVLLIIASCINPSGIRGATYGYQLSVFDESVTISENRSLARFHQEESYWNPSINAFYPAAGLFLLALLAGFRRRFIFFGLAGVSTMILGFAMLRGTAFFALMFVPATAAYLHAMGETFRDRSRIFTSVSVRTWIRRAQAAGIALLFGIAILLLWQTVDGKLFWYRTLGVGLSAWSQDSAEFFRREGLHGPIFNDMDIGSYLIFELYPTEKVFSDNRFGDAYSPALLTGMERMFNDEGYWQEQSARYGFNAIYLYQYNKTPGATEFVSRRIRDPEWVWVYADPFAIIFVRNIPENTEAIEKYAITPENFPQRMQPLLESGDFRGQVVVADLATRFGDLEYAQRLYKRVVAQWPDRGVVWATMGMIEASRGDAKSAIAAIDYLNHALEAGRTTAEVYSFLGLAHAIIGEYNEAEKAFRKALSIDPEREDAREFLEKLRAEGLVSEHP